MAVVEEVAHLAKIARAREEAERTAAALREARERGDDPEAVRVLSD